MALLLLGCEPEHTLKSDEFLLLSYKRRLIVSLARLALTSKSPHEIHAGLAFVKICLHETTSFQKQYLQIFLNYSEISVVQYRVAVFHYVLRIL
jgi:hypothetical protein